MAGFTFFYFSLVAPALAAGAPTSGAAPATSAERLVSIGGAVTEIVYALGAGPQVVGTDTSSVYPPEVARLPRVGYQRTFSVEGVVSLRPTLVLLSPDAGPPAALEQLRSAGLRLHRLHEGPDAAAARARIREVGALLGRKAQADELVQRLDRDLERAQALAARLPRKPVVLFVYARGAGAAAVSGRDTSPAALIGLAGGRNAVEAFTGFKPLTAEAALQAAPDVILIPSRGLDSLGGRAALLNLPGISATPAARAGRVVAMDDLLVLGAGPRLGQAAVELAGHLAAAPGKTAGAAEPSAGKTAGAAGPSAGKTVTGSKGAGRGAGAP